MRSILAWFLCYWLYLHGCHSLGVLGTPLNCGDPLYPNACERPEKCQ